jgi:hypothetical protein
VEEPSERLVPLEQGGAGDTDWEQLVRAKDLDALRALGYLRDESSGIQAASVLRVASPEAAPMAPCLARELDGAGSPGSEGVLCGWQLNCHGCRFGRSWTSRSPLLLTMFSMMLAV